GDMGNAHDEEDEDEDADFNPFLRTNSADVSSSLNSEVEDVQANDIDSSTMNHDETLAEETIQRHVNNDQEAAVLHFKVSSGNICARQYDEIPGATAEKAENVCISLPDEDVCKFQQKDFSSATAYKKSIADSDDGAICMRTRARYSLASFTLDELETFLQETDDEDDLQRVDDEEEYRKFLAAVLQGDDNGKLPEIGNCEDEDEENDADFELELEEALESEHEDIEKRSRTRLNKRKKASHENSKKRSGLTGRPLRPLIPLSSIGPFSCFEGKQFTPSISHSFIQPPNDSFSGFTPHQVGQLHCLIHEHVQLLIQIFSICVSEPGKSNIAAEVKVLISEMLRFRVQALSWRKAPYPSFCFAPPYVRPSVTNEVPRMLQQNFSYRNGMQDMPSGNDKNLPPSNISLSNDEAGCPGIPWTPYIVGPVLSIMDVAPLQLAENYVSDATAAVRAFERSRIELSFENHCQKDHLFPFHSSSGSAESENRGEIDNNSPDSDLPKKSMAATLLEKAKTQPIYLVPKDIAKLAQRFLPFFNPSLYPHKPPPAPLANRVLFTEVEDELLAMGLMEYNTDWKAIQQRFLPCKSRHQIFVRQKNRASSKAPENPIKAVRRMKTSPLTPEEIARIEAGLKMFKLDWISIWSFLLPHRDPALLPRQWRIALGTQKSYKSDAKTKAKRRLNELRRKASKPSHSSLYSPSDKEGYSSDNASEEANRLRKHSDNDDEAYVHEAFLSDWRPNNNVPSIFYASMQPGMNTASGSGQNRLLNYPASSALRYTQIYPWPHRGRRKNSARVVKLAPDLPPVNLPPSVRIISQSVFQRDQAAASAKASVNIQGSNYGTVANGARDDSGSSTKCAANCQPSSNGSGVVIPETGDRDLEMHPLFFRSPQDAHWPYYPQNSGLSLSLFHHPRHLQDPAMSFLNHGKCPPSSGVVFHPLLQSNKAVETGTARAVPTTAKTASRSSKGNELDLDIHLSVLPENRESTLQKPVAAAVAGRDDNNEAASREMNDATSFPDIVMEQEELSDSEDEYGENVEFECEEMADSEGESSTDSE
ncbi:hypothetical protein M569_00028, partial [Genlisea aurea]